MKSWSAEEEDRSLPGVVVSHSEEQQERPWQYDWKRPQWNTVSNRIGEDQGQKGRPVYHSSASVSLHEIECDNDDRHGFRLPESVNDNSRYTNNLLLTVTLLVDDNSSRKGAKLRSSSNERKLEYADSILLEVIRHQNGEDDSASCEQEIVFSRLLRWPESALIQEDGDGDDDDEAIDDQGLDEAYEDDEAESDQRDGIDCSQPMPNNLLALFGKVGKQKPAPFPSQKQRASGIVSACLCRLPPLDPESAVTDALGIVQLLSLGGGGTAATRTNKGGLDLGSQQLNEGQPRDQRDSRLVLCCLHSKGKVYVYSPSRLLNRGSPSTGKTADGDDIDGDMASLFLGDTMLKTLHATYLPLTEPLQTIRLSVPVYSRRLESSHPFDTASKQQLLDAAVWDTTVDGPSLRYRTKDNVPCMMLYAFDMLCVAGPGRRVRKRKDFADGSDKDMADVGSTAEFSAGDLESQNRTYWSEGTGSVTHFTLAPTSRGRPALRLPTSGPQAGGFVSFLSLQGYYTVRTVYLPFAPIRISAFQWGYMRFLLVVGGGGSDRNQSVVVAIRMDDVYSHRLTMNQSSKSPTAVQLNQPPPSDLATAMTNAIERSEMDGTNANKEKKFVSIRRFQIVPVDLEGIEEAPSLVAGSSTTTVPPSLTFVFVDNHGAQMNVLQRELVAISQVPCFDESTGLAPHPLFRNYRLSSSSQDEAEENEPLLTRIESQWDSRRVCRIPISDEISAKSLWCSQGQGWCLLGGVAGKTLFVSWEGSTSLQGAYAAELADARDEVGQHLTSFIEQSGDESVTYDIGMHIPTFEGMEEQRVASNLFPAERLDEEADSEQDDPFLVGAIESISSLSYRKSTSTNGLTPGRGGEPQTFSHEEKSERLLRRCTSWNMLEQSETTRKIFSMQTPVVSLRLSGKAHTMSLRSCVVNQNATPFQHILSWLADSGDYFAAASLALDLLRDGKALHHLWSSFDKIDLDDEVSKIKGLLDGVEPLDETAGDDLLTTLADMTVACLTKGGYSMSSTLNLFLAEDSHYDATRATIMLGAVTARMLSGDENVVAATLGDNYDERHDAIVISPPIEDLVWPVRCLLQVGVARDNLKDVLVLLNATVPDELRRRPRRGVSNQQVPSMELCKELVSLILASHPNAAIMLLTLIDEQSRAPYWNSLEYETQLSLSTIRIEGTTPLLLQEEVRGWVLTQLHIAIQAEGAPTRVHVFEHMTNDWLREVVWACLQSCGCDVDALQQNTDGGSMETDDRWGILRFSRSIDWSRSILAASLGEFGIDYDIVISALLLLKERNEPWCMPKSTLSTQDLLSACCYAAGRRSMNEPKFPLDASVLMRLCYIAGNIQAGGNLVGGEDGLVLQCINILVHGVGLEVSEAEAFLTGDGVNSKRSLPSSANAELEINVWHRQLLALMEQHVMRVHKYGDFDSGRRGTVDPVFGAQTCLRCWMRLNEQEPGGSRWIVAWLRRRLEISEDAESKHRLACAAFVRALLFPKGKAQPDEGKDATLCLAEQMAFPNHFVIELSHSCCGLVEAVPKEAWQSY